MHLLQLLRSGESWNGDGAQFAEDFGIFGLRKLFALLLAFDSRRPGNARGQISAGDPGHDGRDRIFERPGCWLASVGDGL